MIDQFHFLIEAYSFIWNDNSNVINMLKSEHMLMSMTDEWNLNSKLKLEHWVYSQDREEWALINKTFNKLHADDKMTWTIKSTLFDWPVFVVWKTVYERLKKIPVHKEWVVVNIQWLNEILLEDSYSLLLQNNIIAALQRCLYISTMNRLSFFHQFLVCITDQHKFIIVSHCDQK